MQATISATQADATVGVRRRYCRSAPLAAPPPPAPGPSVDPELLHGRQVVRSDGRIEPLERLAGDGGTAGCCCCAGGGLPGDFGGTAEYSRSVAMGQRPGSHGSIRSDFLGRKGMCRGRRSSRLSDRKSSFSPPRACVSGECVVETTRKSTEKTDNLSRAAGGHFIEGCADGAVTHHTLAVTLPPYVCSVCLLSRPSWQMPRTRAWEGAAQRQRVNARALIQIADRRPLSQTVGVSASKKREREDADGQTD